MAQPSSCRTVSCLVFLALSIFVTFSIANAAGQLRGFSVDIVHRDSPHSPLFDATQPRWERTRNAVARSFHRASRLFWPKSLSPEAASTGITASSGEYLINISLGTPPFAINAIADTGSDLIWTQCKPCSSCYKQKTPLFDPRSSETFRELPCRSQSCNSSVGASGSFCSAGEACSYQVAYGDQSHSRGVVASETMTLGSENGRPVKLPKILIGCGHDNDGKFSPAGSGIIGLGGGPASLISQLDSQIGGKFSYCLVPYFINATTTSKMSFGSDAVVSGRGTRSTPLFNGDPPTFYFLKLDAFTVGTDRIEFNQELSFFQPSSLLNDGGSIFSDHTPSEDYGPSEKSGNIIIDSGTTLVLLPDDFYNQVATSVTNQITAKQIQDPTSQLSLCFEAASFDHLGAPPITVHFDGADVKLNNYNAFVNVAENVVCFAFASGGEYPIYGNLAQMNFLVGYDLQSGTVSFKPTDCTTHH